MSLRALGEATGFSDTKLSFWETGQRLPDVADLEVALDALGASDDDREYLLRQRREVEGPGLLVAGAPSMGDALAQLVDHEQLANKITAVASLVQPGLLQTPDYARAVFEGLPDAGKRVALRMGRQEILTRAESPVELHALIDSEVLIRPIAGPAVIAAQLRHLLKMAALPNVTIQVVPSMAPGYSPHLAGAFIVIEFPTAAPVVHVESQSTSTMLWDPSQTAEYQASARQIANRAMTPARTAEVIAEIVNGMEPRHDDDTA